MKRLILCLMAVAVIMASEQGGEAGQRRRACCGTSVCSPPVGCVCVGVSQCDCVTTGTESVPVEQAATQITRTSSVVRECDGTVCRSRTVTRETGTVSSLAQSKAQQLASLNRLVHLGGGYGGGAVEGIGMGSSPEQATQSACYWGQRTPIDIGTAQSSSGHWYAVVLYR